MFEALPSYIPDADLAQAWYEAEMAYQHGELETSKRLLDDIVGDDEHPEVVIAALTTSIAVSVASGQGERAYSDLRRAIGLCNEGLRHRDDQTMWCASMVGALRVEDLLLAQVFDFPSFDKDIEQLPLRTNPYVGYLLAARMMRYRNRMGSGICYVYLRLLGGRNKIAEVYLNVAMASSFMAAGNLKDAEGTFRYAWELGKKYQIVMPFMEHNYSLLGLPRHCLGEINNELGNQMKRRLRLYHKGWFALRECCGLTTAKSPLTPLELDIVLLVSFGWRNKEISQYLHIAESTVKHNLSNVYQKCGVLNRTEAQQMIEKSVFHTKYEQSARR